MADQRQIDKRAREVIDFVPIAALRIAVENSGRAPAGFANMTGATLRKHILAYRLLPGSEIIELFEQWRYGSRVALTCAVFLKRPRSPGPGFRDQVTKELRSGLEEGEATAAEREVAITINGEDHFDDGHVTELSFRYGHVIDYLDLQERPQSVVESRFGFAWINPRDQFVAVTGEEHIVEEMLGAIGIALGAHPVRVALDKRTLDAHFQLESISSILHLNLVTGTRHRVSRESLKGDPEAYEEIQARDRDNVRLGALYGEPIASAGMVGVGVSAERSRINTTRAVAVSDLRAWAAPKLGHIARSLLELHEKQPILFFANTRGHELSGVPRIHQATVGELAVGVATCRTEDRDRALLMVSAATIASRLPAKAGRLCSRPDCAGCHDQVLAQCQDCLGNGITVSLAGETVCAICGKADFNCMNGHRLKADSLAGSLTYEPSGILTEWISVALVAMGLEAFDSTREAFWIRGSDVLYTRKPLAPSGDYTVLMVDIENSTVLGRDRAAFAELVAMLRGALMAVTRDHRGRFAQDTGDGGFTLFAKAVDAVAAACRLTKIVHDSAHNRRGAAVRVGLASGWVDTAGGRYTGQAINLADRLQKTARSGTRIALDAKTLLNTPGVKASARGHVKSLPGFAADEKRKSDTNEDYYLLDQCPDLLP